MIREIKFRAWNKNFEEYDEVASINFKTRDVILFDYGIADFSEVVLEQYTGLKDKNGVEIYVGDIVEFEYEDFDCNGDNGIIDKERLVVGSPFDIDWLYHSDDYIVIRNIHENKELLK